MRKSNTSKSLFFLVAIALVMMAVQVGAPRSVSAQDPTATGEPTATLAASTEGTLTIWINLERAAVMEEAGARFEEEFGVPVRVQTMGFGDVRTNFNIAAPAGEGPDIIVGAHDWIGQLYSNGLLAPIELPEDVAANFDPQALGLFTYDGQLVGLPYAVEAVALYYNKDLVEEVPATFEEAVTLAQELVESGAAERGIAIPPDPYHTYPIISGFGGYVFGRDADGNYDPSDVGIDSEGALAGAAYLDQLVKDDVFNAAVGYDQARELFLNGQLAMWVTGPWELSNIRNSGVNFGVATIPTMVEEPRPFIGGQGFMVNAFSKNLDLAQAFLAEYVATEETQQGIYDAVPGISAFLPTREANPDPDLEAFAASVANGDPMPTIPQMAAFWNTVGNAVTQIYNQAAEPEAAFREAAEAAREEIAAGSN
jgi:maltose-binding protein MalE